MVIILRVTMLFEHASVPWSPCIGHRAVHVVLDGLATVAEMQCSPVNGQADIEYVRHGLSLVPSDNNTNHNSFFNLHPVYRPQFSILLPAHLEQYSEQLHACHILARSL